jgi:hypothetical protein
MQQSTAFRCSPQFNGTFASNNYTGCQRDSFSCVGVCLQDGFLEPLDFFNWTWNTSVQPFYFGVTAEFPTINDQLANDSNIAAQLGYHYMIQSCAVYFYDLTYTSLNGIIITSSLIPSNISVSNPFLSILAENNSVLFLPVDELSSSIQRAASSSKTSTQLASQFSVYVSQIVAASFAGILSPRNNTAEQVRQDILLRGSIRRRFICL